VVEPVAPANAAVIRPDDVFRGEGIPKITVEATNKPFVVRGTQQEQIDDMISSGLVRPKPGGYGKQKSAQIYFGESDTAVPSGVFARPKEGEFTLVGKSENLVGKEGPISIDQLEHIWENRNGDLVDVLPNILRQNQEFAPTAAPGPAFVSVETQSALESEIPVITDELPSRLKQPKPQTQEQEIKAKAFNTGLASAIKSGNMGVVADYLANKGTLPTTREFMGRARNQKKQTCLHRHKTSKELISG
jgi:hypothetical protein